MRSIDEACHNRREYAQCRVGRDRFYAVCAMAPLSIAALPTAARCEVDGTVRNGL